MPAFETMDRYQLAVLLPVLADNAYGETTVDRANAVEISVRWVRKQMQAGDAKQDLEAFDATAVVDRDIDIGSILWLGSMEDFLGTGSAGDAAEMMMVKASNKTPDIKGRNIRWTIGLDYYAATLPAQG